MRTFSELSEQEILALAISLEEEYTNLSADMRQPIREALLAAQKG